MIVLFGKGRRLTIRELQALTISDLGVPQWHQPQQLEEAVEKSQVLDLSRELDLLTLVSDDSISLLSPSETEAFLAVLTLSIAQGRTLNVPSKQSEEIAHKLLCTIIQAKQQKKELRFPEESELIQSKLLDLVGPDINIPIYAIERSVRLSRLALQVCHAMDLAAVALPVSAITVDSMGFASVLSESSYCETAFDVLRPHRSMITSAATLRAILNDSRFVNKETEISEIASVFKSIPQYHGPASEDIKTAAKRLELELNSVTLNPETPLDLTMWKVIQEHLSNAVEILLNASNERIATATKSQTKIDESSKQSLSNMLKCLDESISFEASIAIQKISEVDAVEANEARQKAATKETSASLHPTSGNDAGKDEFEGMTEAQKTKILKKRAEKEAKIAAKLQAKKEKGVSKFGAGTQPICQILQACTVEGKLKLTREGIQDLVSLQEKLLSGGVQRKPKIPKGTRDYLPEQMMIRQQAFSIIRRVFEAHGAVEIDTPVFELKDTLTGKYGEDSKLIYDLADQGGELLALRYDLTVPFARFLALNSVGNIKRFHIGKVYRRDQPALKRGRYREFYQCDFDIAGNYGRMVPDSECLCVACDILHNLPIGDFAIKLNHRRLLDAILDICGVPAEKFRTICSAVDKLDKEPWAEVKREMVEDKGLPEDVANKIGQFVLNKGNPLELHKELTDSKRFGNHKGAHEAMEDLRILFDYLDAFDKLKFISFDLSLARGLDYYTGVIYEAVCMNGNNMVGSIGGGGRYDNLVGMFQEAGKQTPCVGVSVGIERVFTLMEERLKIENGSTKKSNVSVLVACAGDSMMIEKMRISRMLWDSNISAEFNQQENVKLKKEVEYALDAGIPFMVVVGESELKEGKVVVQDLAAKSREPALIVDIVKILRTKGVVPVGCEFAMEILNKEL